MPFDCEFDGGYPPLDEAVLLDSPARVSALLEAGADPNARWAWRGDRFPLQSSVEAASYGRITRAQQAENVALLLRHGADPNARWCPFESRGDYGIPWQEPCRSERGVTPLQMAVARDQPEVVALLLAAGADPHLRSGTTRTPLRFARSIAVLNLLLPALYPSSADRDATALASLVEQPYGHSEPGPWHGSPLIDAIHNADHARRSSPSHGSKEGAAAQARDGRVEVVLALGADVNERLTWGAVDWTPLAFAVATGRPFVVSRLLARGADPNARWCVPVYSSPKKRQPAPGGCTLQNGTTPLMAAALNGDIETARQLVRAGAAPEAHDWQGKTAIDFAPEVSREALVKAMSP